MLSGQIIQLMPLLYIIPVLLIQYVNKYTTEHNKWISCTYTTMTQTNLKWKWIQIPNLINLVTIDSPQLPHCKNPDQSHRVEYTDPHTHMQTHTWVRPVGLLSGGSPESCTAGSGPAKALDRVLRLDLASCQRCGGEEHGDRRVSINSTLQPCLDTCWAGWQPTVSSAALPRKLPPNNMHSWNKGQQQLHFLENRPSYVANIWEQHRSKAPVDAEQQ